jgi:hypothetical protein
MAQAIFSFIADIHYYCNHIQTESILQIHFFLQRYINTRECTQMIYELLFVSYLWIFLRPFGGKRQSRAHDYLGSVATPQKNSLCVIQVKYQASKKFDCKKHS